MHAAHSRGQSRNYLASASNVFHMLTSTIVLSGKVVVENVLFSWWVTDCATPRITLSHAAHGTASQPLTDSDPRTQARAVAKAMLARTTRSGPAKVVRNIGGVTHDQADATIVLGEDYRRAVEDGFSSDDEQ
jgi:hypothetical protein